MRCNVPGATPDPIAAPPEPGEIIDAFDLLRPIYRATASYGHFGREGFPWEEIISF